MALLLKVHSANVISREPSFKRTHEKAVLTFVFQNSPNLTSTSTSRTIPVRRYSAIDATKACMLNSSRSNKNRSCPTNWKVIGSTMRWCTQARHSWGQGRLRFEPVYRSLGLLPSCSPPRTRGRERPGMDRSSRTIEQSRDRTSRSPAQAVPS